MSQNIYLLPDITAFFFSLTPSATVATASPVNPSNLIENFQTILQVNPKTSAKIMA